MLNGTAKARLVIADTYFRCLCVSWKFPNRLKHNGYRDIRLPVVRQVLSLCIMIRPIEQAPWQIPLAGQEIAQQSKDSWLPQIEPESDAIWRILHWYKK